MDTTYRQNSATEYGQHSTGISVPQVLRWSRMALRILSLVCGAGCVGVAAFYNSEWTIGPLIMNGPPAILSIAWSLADIIFLSIRRGIHPAACIVVDTILVLALAALTGVLGFTMSKLSDSGYYFAFYPPGEQGVEYLRIILAFGVLGTLFHFLTLVLVIYELKHRRKVAKQSSYVAGQYDGSFGEAPPAYVGPSQSTRQQNLAYQPHDEIVAPAQELYELPAKKTRL